MIILKLSRDELNSILFNFCHYIERLIKIKLEHSNGNNQILNRRMIYSIWEDLQMKISRQALTVSMKKSLKLTDAEAVIFYKTLMNLPIEQDKVYLFNLRQKITDFLHKQLLNPQP